jgi:hypothetical protein
MTQAELNREVAYATGESVDTIAQMGFVVLTRIPIEREPLRIDWDRLDVSDESVLCDEVAAGCDIVAYQDTKRAVEASRSADLDQGELFGCQSGDGKDLAHVLRLKIDRRIVQGVVNHPLAVKWFHPAESP